MIPKPLDKIDVADIQALVTNCDAERRTLDFKRELPGNKEKDYNELRADVTSFANTSGGDLIFGVDETGGVATDVCGLPEVDADAEIRRIESVIQERVHPRVPGFESRAITIPHKGPVIVVRVPGSRRRPHLVKINETFRVFGRNSKGKYPLDEGEIRSTFLGAAARRWRWIVAASVLLLLLTTWIGLNRSPSLLFTPSLVGRLSQGLDVEVNWSDIKAADVVSQGGGPSGDKAVVDRNAYLWRVRTHVQRRIYRSGSIDTTTPNPGEVDLAAMLKWFVSRGTDDTGDGRLHLDVAPIDHRGPWVVHGHGFLREHKRSNEQNHELWGAELTSEPIDSFNGDKPIRVNLKLFSCVPKDPNTLTLYFFVVLDQQAVWRPTPEDDDYFRRTGSGKEGSVRVFLDPTTTFGEPTSSSVGFPDDKLHVATMSWPVKQAP